MKSRSEARVAIEFTAAVTQTGGVARSVHDMTDALLRAAAYDYTLFTAGGGPLPDDIARLAPNVRRAPLSALTMTRMWQRLRVPLPVELFAGRHDLFFATDFALPPTLPRTKTAVFIHDLTFVRVPDAAVESLVAYLSAAVPRAITRADVVIVNSEATKDDIIDVYGTSAEKIVPVQFGVHPRFAPSEAAPATVRRKYGLPDGPYILAVGTVQPRKNYGRLIAAVDRLRDEGADVTLAIAGGKGWLDAEIRQMGGTNHDAVRFLGYVDDHDLPALYSEAAAFAMPSLYEGFGLPVLEAMACGAPVLTSNVSSLPEAAGDAAVLVDPTDIEAIADGLRRLLDDATLAADLTARGRARAAAFTWERTAAQIAAAFALALRS